MSSMFEYSFIGGPYEGWRQAPRSAMTVVLQNHKGEMHEYRKTHATEFQYHGETKSGSRPARRRIVIRD